MDMMMTISIFIVAVVIVIVYKGLTNKRLSDSALRQRAVFNSIEQLTFIRLKEILSEANILAHVSFDALITTKFQHTRNKYQKMFADFVILDKDYRVIAIVALEDQTSTKRANEAKYQEALLQAAGYRVIRYSNVPEYQQIRDSFLIEFSDINYVKQEQLADMGKLEYYHEQVLRRRVYG